MIFKYYGYNKLGNKIEGKIEAHNINEVKSKLNDIIITEIKPAKYNFNISFSSKISPKELSKLFHTLSLYIKSSIPLITAISLTKNQIANNKLLKFLDFLENSIKEGNSFYNSLQTQKIIKLPNYVANTIKIGEESGKLDIVLKEISKFLKDEEKLSSKTKSALLYPMFIVVVAIFMVTFMLTAIVPKIVKVFENMHQTLPNITQIVIKSGYFLQHNYISILFILFSTISIFQFFYNKNSKFKFFIHKFLLKIPFINSIILSKELGKFSYLIAVLVKSGVNYIVSINLAINSLENEFIKSIFQKALKEVNEGKKFSISLQKAGFDFDTSFLQSIALGEETSQIDEVLENISEIYFEENETKIQTIVGLLEPTLIVIVGVSIGFIVTAIMLPMFSMSMIK